MGFVYWWHGGVGEIPSKWSVNLLELVMLSRDRSMARHRLTRHCTNAGCSVHTLWGCHAEPGGLVGRSPLDSLSGTRTRIDQLTRYIVTHCFPSAATWSPPRVIIGLFKSAVDSPARRWWLHTDLTHAAAETAIVPRYVYSLLVYTVCSNLHCDNE